MRSFLFAAALVLGFTAPSARAETDDELRHVLQIDRVRGLDADDHYKLYRMAMGRRSPSLRAAAIESLAVLEPGPELAKAIELGLTDVNPGFRIGVLQHLARLTNAEDRLRLYRMALTDEESQVVQVTRELIAQLPPGSELDALNELIQRGPSVLAEGDCPRAWTRILRLRE